MGAMILRSLISLQLVLMLSSASHAESRIALLIGNQAYNEKVGPLKNPHNDIALVGTALEKLGFTVTLIKDAGYRAIDTALKQHIQQVRRAGKDPISFVYYSGHGAADPDTQINYLIPVDVESANDSSLWTNSLELGDILNKLRNQAPYASHFVVFDACREELRLTRDDKKALGTGKGFVALGNVSGVMIAYATAPGKTASDIGEGAGPYAKVLADEIVKPGIEAVTMFRNVQLRVKLAIGQDPWLTFPTLPAVYFAGESSNALSQKMEIELAYWESVTEKKSPAVLATYLERYPTGIYASLARAMIEELKAEQTTREQMGKATEAERIAAEQRVRETVLTEGEHEPKNSAQVKEIEERHRKEALARAEELRKTLRETRLAREEARKAEEQRLAAINATEEAKARAKQAGLAADIDDKRSPPELAKDPPALTRALQRELKRVGCYPGEADGTWAPKTKEALVQFARLAKLELATDVPSAAALQAVIDRQARVCPLICGPGERNVNGKCAGNARPTLRPGISLDGPGDAQRAGAFCQGSSVCRSWSNP
jgi:Caspase domain/Putative peptidoglycan binding domain